MAIFPVAVICTLVAVHNLLLLMLAAVSIVTLSSSWYLVILCTGLMRAEEMELARPCLLWTSCTSQNFFF